MQNCKLSHNDQKRDPYTLNGEIRKMERLGHISNESRRPNKLSASLTLTAILTLLNIGFTIVPIVEARPTVWHVHPGDSIQAFVDSSSPGDKIIVHTGEYHQSVIITKSIKLIGNGAILDGNPPADTGTTLEGDGIAIAQGVSGVIVKGFEIRDYSSSASSVVTADGASNIKIINNMIYNVFSGIYIGNGKNVVISNNVVKDSDFRGIEIAADITNSENIKVMNNKVTEITTLYPEFGGHGIYVIGVKELKNVMIMGNQISDCQNDGVKVRSDVDPGDVRNVLISGNKIDNNGDIGINLEGVSYAKLRMNKVTNNMRSGILLSASDHIDVIAGSVLDNGYGIVIAGSENNRVIGNRVRKNREWGIALVEDEYHFTSNNNVVASNIAKGNVLYDLYDDGTGTGNIWRRSNIYKTKNW